MRKYLVNEDQMDGLLGQLIHESNTRKILECAYGTVLLAEGSLEDPEERAIRFNNRLDKLKFPNGLFKKVYSFGMFGNDGLALAETLNDCYIFINKNGFPEASFAIDLNKVVSKNELFAGFMNSVIGKPLYRHVVNLYGCAMKVIDAHNVVRVIDVTTGRILGDEEEPSNSCLRFPPFTPDPTIVRKAQELDKKELVLKPKPPKEEKPVTFRVSKHAPRKK